jgi:peroxin-3
MLPFCCRLQAHFEKVKRICDTTTLPLAMHHLSDKITSQLDISKLTDKLRQAKVDSSALTPKEKYETWEEIKIKSMVLLILSTLCMTCWVYSLSSHKYAFLTLLLFFVAFL